MSYSDLMAGLLMVFALMLFVAVYHYSQQLNTRIGVIEGALTPLDVREELIDSLREYLRENPNAGIEVDTITAMIRLKDHVLFEEGRAELLPAGQAALSSFVDDILPIILEQEGFVSHLDEIIVEGHTNDNGPFYYNLSLSQQRAFVVMEFLLEAANPTHRPVLERHMTANGRSFSWPICSDGQVRFYQDPECGSVDKELSRRIELRFRLDDEEALRQVDSLLKAGAQ